MILRLLYMKPSARINSQTPPPLSNEILNQKTLWMKI